jgi:hypothetical protein
MYFLVFHVTGNIVKLPFDTIENALAYVEKTYTKNWATLCDMYESKNISKLENKDITTASAKLVELNELHYHEVLHMAHCAAENFASNIVDHVAVMQDPKLRKAARDAEAALSMFYSVAGDVRFDKFP